MHYSLFVCSVVVAVQGSTNTQDDTQETLQSGDSTRLSAATAAAVQRERVDCHSALNIWHRHSAGWKDFQYVKGKCKENTTRV